MDQREIKDIVGRGQATWDIEGGVNLLRTKSRDKEGTASTMGQPPDRLKRADY